MANKKEIIQRSKTIKEIKNRFFRELKILVAKKRAIIESALKKNDDQKINKIREEINKL